LISNFKEQIKKQENPSFFKTGKTKKLRMIKYGLFLHTTKPTPCPQMAKGGQKAAGEE
jgi:hypothetical protein